MQLSQYSKIFPSDRDASSLILFSTVTTAAVRMPSAVIADIENGRLSSGEQETLTGLGLLSPNDREQEQMAGYLRDLNALNTVFRLIVVLNLDCNLACTYCFEGSRKGKHYLSGKTARDLVSFIGTGNLAGKKEIRISFYGGEPLLSTGVIEKLSEQIAPLAAERGLRYSFNLVTNGTLLTAAVVRKLKPLGLTGAKVTLDGPAGVHDRFRPFRTGRGSFGTIIGNLEEVCDLIRIQIGGNYTQESFRAFPRLLDELAARGLTPDRVPLIKFDPVIRENREFGNPDFCEGCASVNEPWISEASLLLRREVLERGYGTPRITPASCMLQLEESFVVNWDGSLYKCPGLIGRDQCRAGHVATGLREYAGTHGLDDWKNEHCLACAYLPLCFGGCKYLLLIKTGSMRGINCQKEFFERTLGGLVAQDLEFER